MPAAAQCPYGEDFTDNDLAEWTIEHQNSGVDWSGSTLHFYDNGGGGGKHDEHNHFYQQFSVPNHDLQLQGRFMLDNTNTSRDQKLAIEYYLIDGGGNQIGYIEYYTEWEGCSGTDGCSCDYCNWCDCAPLRDVYNWNGGSSNGLSVNIEAQNTWKSFDESLNTIINNELTGVNKCDIEEVKMRITAGGAWGEGSDFYLDYAWVQCTPSSPDSATASPDTVCPGNSSTLSVSGSLSSLASWEWYSGTCGGTFVGSGSSVTVSPASTTTYYVRAEGTCDTTACVSTTVDLYSGSTAPSGASASPDPICPGNSSTLTVSGGALGKGASWEWYSASCGGTSEGSGSSISVTPASTTTYYVRAEGTCDTTACADVTVNLNSTSTAPSGANPSSNPICPGNSTTLNVSGGSLGTGGTWEWYSSSCGGTFEGTGSSITVSPSSATTYYVRAEGTCDTTACANVTVNLNNESTAPSAAKASNDPICPGESTTLNLSGGSLGTGASWEWYSGSCGGTSEGSGSSISVTPASTTTYFVRAEGTCDTTSCATVTVDLHTSSTAPGGASASPNAICSGSNSTLSVSGGALGAGASWEWYSASCGGTSEGSGPNITVSPASTTTYYVRAEGTCDTTACASVTVTVGAPTVTLDSASDVTCNGNCDGAAYVSVSGGVTPYTYQWDDPSGQTTQDATGLCAGTYRVISTDDNGCKDSTQVTIGEPSQVQVSSSSDTTICIGGTATLSASASGGTPGYSYHWNNGLGTGQSHNVSPGSNTVYKVVAEDANGCFSDSLAVQLNYHPPLQVSTSPDDSVCPGNAVQISATGSGGIGSGYSYTWSNGMAGSSVSLAPNSTQDHVVTLEDGCETPSVTDTVTVTVNELPNVKIDGQDLTGCRPVNATLINSTADSMVSSDCVWSFGDGEEALGCDTVRHLYDDPGCYDVTLNVSSPEGCVDSATAPDMVCVNPYPTAKFSFEPEASTVQDPAFDFTNLSTGASSYHWDFGGVDSSNVQHPSFEFPDEGAGTYKVCLTAANSYGCKDTSCKEVTVNGEFLLYVPNAFTPDGDGKNELFGPVIQGVDPSDYRFEVYDRWGQLVFETKDPSEKWDGSIKGDQKASKTDVYVWKVVAKSKYTKETVQRQGHVTLIR